LNSLDVFLVAAPSLPLALTLVNLASWRLPRPGTPPAKTSALVPARNEEATIGACVRALLAEPVHEVVVYDDASEDGTARILEEIAATDPRLRVVCGDGLPAGWVGKPHACHQLAAAATGDHLWFVDADTVVLPGALARIGGVDADVVTALPGQRIETFGERLVVPLLHLTYLSWLPLALVRLVPDPRVLAANGQVLALSRAAYDRIGGFSAVRAEVVDDMAFCRLAKARGLRVAFVDGAEIASCRMYGSLGEAWRGFSKNLYEGVGHPVAMAVVTALYVACFLGPWLLWPLSPAWATVGIALGLLQRALLALRFRLPASTVLLHPLSILAFVGIAFTSWRWSRTDRIAWRGRIYSARAAR
jgi:chlorobactene glucosyltransferase